MCQNPAAILKKNEKPTKNICVQLNGCGVSCLLLGAKCVSPVLLSVEFIVLAVRHVADGGLAGITTDSGRWASLRSPQIENRRLAGDLYI